MSVPHVGRDVDLPDGDWKHLGAMSLAEKRKGMISDGPSFEIKDGRVVSRSGGLLVQEWDPEKKEAGSPISVSRPSRVQNRLDLSLCEPKPMGVLGDGLYVCSEQATSFIVFAGEIVMSGSYKRLFLDREEVSA